MARLASSLTFAVVVLAHVGCYDADAPGGGNGGSGGSSGATAGRGGSSSGGSSGSGGSQGGSSSAQGGTAGQGGSSGGSAGVGTGGAAGVSGGGGAGEGGEASSSGGSSGEGGAPGVGGTSGDAGAENGSGGSGDATGSGGEPGAGGASGSGNAGSGGGAGSDVGPSCTDGNVPLVWILLSTASGMFEETVIGPNEAWYVVRTALTGPDGALGDLDGHANVGLTLFGGVATETCPRYSVVEPSTDTSAAAELIDAVAPPIDKQESPLPAAYLATVELVRARPETDKTIVIIANSVPDFCNDTSTYCPRDNVIGHVQDAFDEGIRTLLVGIQHSVDANDEERVAYFQAVANAGRGYPAEIFANFDVIEASCFGEVLAEYGTTSQRASWVSGGPSSTTFSTDLRDQLVALGCP